MRNFQKKRGVLGILQSMPSLILLTALVCVFAYSMISFTSRMQETAKNKKIAEDKVAELQNSKEKLSLDIAKLNTDQGLEENIRERFGLVKEGEEVIVIVEDKNQPEIPLEANSWSFFSFFINLFK